MKIGILGSGSVGDTIGKKLLSLEHEVFMGSRSATNEKALKFTQDSAGKGHAGTFTEAAAFGEIIFNVTKGEASIQAIASCYEAAKGKILIDISNPLDFSKGAPPSLLPNLSNTNSLGEEIQRQFPELKVVKTLNTMWCGIMVNPTMIGNGDHVNYICGNDENAKKQVVELLLQFGWKQEQLLDLGDITAARATEAVLPIWLRIWSTTKNGAFNFKIIN